MFGLGNNDGIDFKTKQFFMDGYMRMGIFMDIRPMKHMSGKSIIRYKTFTGVVKEIPDVEEGMLVQINRDELGGISSFPVNQLYMKGGNGKNPFSMVLQQRIEDKIRQGNEAVSALKTKDSVSSMSNVMDSQTDIAQLKKMVDSLKGLQLNKPKEGER